jgi:hypothetical protein
VTGAWGGQKNGQIASTLLKPAVNFNPLYAGVSVAAGSNLLRAEAADQWSSLALEFADFFGKPLYGSEFYRALGRQNLLYADWLRLRQVLAAYPGTSNHGWASAIDLGSNVGTWAGAEHKWVAANGPRRGFNFTVKSEGWHVDFGTASVAPIAHADGLLGGVGGDVIMGKPHIMRNKKTGEITVLDVLAGADYHVPGPGYVPAWEEHIGAKTEEVEDNWFGYWRQVADYNRNRMAEAVWNVQAKGFNGTTTMGNRLLGVDQYKDSVNADSIAKIAAAIPKAAAAPVVLDTKALAAALAAQLGTALAPALSAELGKRIANG